MMKNAILMLLLNFLIPTFTQADLLAPGDHNLTMTIGGYDRSYLLHIPKDSDPSKPMPLVMMLHGAGGSSAGSSRAYGWIQKSDAERFVAVFPQGLAFIPTRPSNLLTNPNVWNDHRPEKVAHPQADDVQFLGAVLDEVQHHCNIDPNRIYVTGFSNGASMTFYLATQLSSRIAAIAPVSGHCFFHDAKLTHPIPLMFIVGDSDPLNPYNGGPGKNPWGNPTTKPALIDSIHEWLQFDSESNAPSTTESKDGITTQTWAANTPAPIIFITIANQGHEWPGHHRVLPKTITGNNTMTLDATGVIWDFFKTKSLKSPEQ